MKTRYILDNQVVDKEFFYKKDPDYSYIYQDIKGNPCLVIRLDLIPNTLVNMEELLLQNGFKQMGMDLVLPLTKEGKKCYSVVDNEHAHRWIRFKYNITKLLTKRYWIVKLVKLKNLIVNKTA